MGRGTTPGAPRPPFGRARGADGHPNGGRTNGVRPRGVQQDPADLPSRPLPVDVAEGLTSTLVMLQHKLKDGVQVVRDDGRPVTAAFAAWRDYVVKGLLTAFTLAHGLSLALAVTGDGTLVGADDLAAQTQQVMANLHVALAAAPVAVVCMVAGVIVNVAQVGIKPMPAGIKPDPKKLNPLTGAKNLFGPNMLFEAAKATSKVAIVGAVAAISLLPGITGLASKVGIAPGALGMLAGGRALEVAERAGFAYLLIGVIDYAWQKRRHERELWQQLLDEAKRRRGEGLKRMQPSIVWDQDVGSVVAARVSSAISNRGANSASAWASTSA